MRSSVVSPNEQSVLTLIFLGEASQFFAGKLNAILDLFSLAQCGIFACRFYTCLLKICFNTYLAYIKV